MLLLLHIFMGLRFEQWIKVIHVRKIYSTLLLYHMNNCERYAHVSSNCSRNCSRTERNVTKNIPFISYILNVACTWCPWLKNFYFCTPKGKFQSSCPSKGLISFFLFQKEYEFNMYHN